MAYVSLCKALYDYTASAEDELAFVEDALLYILDDSDAEWWKAKLKTGTEAGADEDEDGPVGLIPANYVEEAEPLRVSRALYDYAKQNDDELDMAEDELMSVFEVKGEWLLVKRQDSGVATGALGFVPANYVDEVAAVDGVAEPMEAQDETELEATPASPSAATFPAPAAPPAAHAPLAAPPQQRRAAKDDEIIMWAAAELDAKKKKKKGTLGIGNSSLFFASEADKAPVQKISVLSIIAHTIENKARQINLKLDDGTASSVATDDSHTIRFVLDKKGEADDVWAKIEESQNKAHAANEEAAAVEEAEADADQHAAAAPSIPAPPPLPTTARMPSAASSPRVQPTGRTILPPPSRTAAARAPAASKQPEPEASAAAAAAAAAASVAGEQAIALYDFEAQGDDELSVAENEQLFLMDRETDDWWKVRNAAGNEGVVPASYVEVTEAATNGNAVHGTSTTGIDDAAAAAAAEEEKERRQQEEEEEAAERERMQAERRAKADAQRRARETEERRRQALKSQPAPAPPRAPANTATTSENAASRDVSIPSNRSAPARPKEATSKSKPSPARTRVWHDRTGQFRVEAEFLGFNQGKIRLHKLNGVVIEVAIEKMSSADIAFLEDVTGRKLMPPGRNSRSAAGSSDPRRSDRDAERRREQEREQRRRRDAGRGPKRNVDWFEFFLAAGVDIDDCTRYASAFERDKIDEAILPDMDAGVLRSIGLREGDILRVIKFIQKRYPSGASNKGQSSADMTSQIKSDEALARKIQEREQSARLNGSTPPPNLFSGPDGSLKNNTRRGRPTPASYRNASGVDAASLAAASESLSQQAGSPARSQTASPELPKAPSQAAAPASPAGGFDDDAWTPRPSSAKPATPATPSPAPAAAPTPPPQPPRPTSAAPPAVAATAPSPVAPPAVPPTPPAEPPKPASDPNSALFDKLAAMKPPSSEMGQQQRPGATPTSSGSFYNGPRGPFAPVAQNTQMLQPLVPTHSAGQFMPTGLGHQPTGMGMQQTGYMQPQQTGYMQPQQTGYMQQQQQQQPTGYNGFGGGMGMSSPHSPYGMAAQPTGFVGSNITGMPGQQPIAPQQTAQQYGSQQQQQRNDEANSGPERFTAANVFGQMKQGTMHQAADTAPQNAQKYDALRPQPTGFQPGGYIGQQYTGFGGGYGGQY